VSRAISNSSFIIVQDDCRTFTPSITGRAVPYEGWTGVIKHIHGTSKSMCLAGHFIWTISCGMLMEHNQEHLASRFGSSIILEASKWLAIVYPSSDIHLQCACVGLFCTSHAASHGFAWSIKLIFYASAFAPPPSPSFTSRACTSSNISM